MLRAKGNKEVNQILADGLCLLHFYTARPGTVPARKIVLNKFLLSSI